MFSENNIDDDYDDDDCDDFLLGFLFFIFGIVVVNGYDIFEDI